jgi:ParB/RepB/Spo0J family partition protein
MAVKPLAPDKKSDYWWVDSRRLKEDPEFNRREDYGDIEALAREIKAHGVDSLNPLTCYKQGENYVVVRGHRRTRALKILEKGGEILMVRILVERKGYSKEMRVLDQITENEGKPYTPWEQALVLRDLRGFGWSDKEIATRSGKSMVYVRRLLSLADAPQKLINLVREGRVSATEAMNSIADQRVDHLIETAKKMQDIPVVADLFSAPAAPAPTKKDKVTSSDIRPNSWKIFKKWAPSVQEDKLSPEKLEAWKLMIKIRDGEATEKDFKKFFS